MPSILLVSGLNWIHGLLLRLPIVISIPKVSESFSTSTYFSNNYYQASKEEIYEYTFDPENPTTIVGGYLLVDGGPKDNQPLLQERLKFKDVVLFTSPIFTVCNNTFKIIVVNQFKIIGRYNNSREADCHIICLVFRLFH